MRFFTDRVTRLRPGRGKRYQHFFGGPPRHRGTVPKCGKHPVHLLYDLDLRDPKLGLTLPGVPRLPLYAAIQYEVSDLTYLVLEEDRIQILAPLARAWSKDFPYEEYPAEFPRVPVVADALQYDDYKTLVFAFTATQQMLYPEELSKRDRELLKNLGYPFTQVGGVQFMWQDVPWWECPNSSCPNRGESWNAEVFAVVWEQPVPNVDLWEPKPKPGVNGCNQLIFSRCRGCGAIHSANACD